MKITQKVEIKNALLKMRAATAPGKTADGQELQIILKFTKRAPDERALAESAVAVKTGLSLRVFTGPLDRVYFSKADEFIMTMLAKERVDVVAGKFCYRSFNVDSGQVESLEVLNGPPAPKEEEPIPAARKPWEFEYCETCKKDGSFPEGRGYWDRVGPTWDKFHIVRVGQMRPAGLQLTQAEYITSCGLKGQMTVDSSD